MMFETLQGAKQFHYALSKMVWTKDELRAECIAGFLQKCAYCLGRGDRINGPDGHPWQLDRWHPGAKGGEYKVDNVVLACKSCNCAKRDRDPSENQRWMDAPTLHEIFCITERFTFIGVSDG